jgi:phage baseplate assembly protein W
MSSIAVRLPLSLDDTDGFGMLKRIREVIKQNLKMLILTEPGERIMDPQFGVGMKRFLFENFSDSVYSQIDSRIREQVRIYMPDVSIRQINFYLIDPDSNSVAFRMEYSIPSIAASDLIEFTI